MIMKTIKLFLTACLSFTFWGNVLYAQEETPEYKKYEKLAKKVNDIQRTVNGKNVKNDNDDFILKIPERNFIFNYHDFTVSNIQSVANNNTKNGEASMIYENIDLASINDIGILDESFGDCGIIILTPNKKQNYKIVIDDEVHSQESESIVFYFLNSDRAKGKEMFDAISELTFLAKIKKGLLTDKEVRDQIKLWNETKESTDTEKYYSFLKKFPNSIFGLMAKTKAESLDSSVKILTKDYVGIYLGMTEKEFIDFVKRNVVSKASEIHKIDKNLKLFVDNFNIVMNKEADGTAYYFENAYQSILYSDSYGNAGSMIPILFDVPSSDKIPLSYDFGSYYPIIESLDINYKKQAMLRKISVPSLFYQFLNVENSDLKNKLIPYSAKSMLSGVKFRNGILYQITYSFIIHETYLGADTILRQLYSLYGTPKNERYLDARREGMEGKVGIFDKGNYYIAATAIQDYSESPFAPLTPYLATITIKAK